jgi:LysM repeat protein
MNYPISKLRRGFNFTVKKRNTPRYKSNSFASTRSLAIRQSQLLTIKDHFNKSNTKTFRTIGAISMLLLGFIIIDSQVNNVQTKVNQINPSKSTTLYREIASFVKQPPQVVAIPVEEKPLPILNYQVVDGDTLTSICSDLKVECSKIIELNNLSKPFTVFIGQKIRFQ